MTFQRFRHGRPVSRAALVPALVVALAFPGPAAAQIFKVPTAEQTAPPVSVTLGAGLLSPQSRFDAADGGRWVFTEAIQYRAKLDWSLRSGSLGVVGTVANVPVARPIGSGDIQLRQLLLAFRTPYRDEFSQTFELTSGWSQWAGYSGSGAATSAQRAARNGFSVAIGYGAAFPLGSRATFSVAQDAGIIVGSGKNLPSGESRVQSVYTTRMELSVLISGRR